MHKLIDQRLTEAKNSIQMAVGDAVEQEFQLGRIDALVKFKDFLTNNFNPKLPRRIRESYFGK